MLLDHIGGKSLALCSEDGVIAFVSTAHVSTFPGATESIGFCSFREGHKHFCSYEAISIG